MRVLHLKIIFLLSVLLFSCSDDETSLEQYDTLKTEQLSQQKNTESLTVLSYNIFHLPGIASVLHYKEVERSKQQFQILSAMSDDVDVIVFQEGFNQHVEKHLFNQLSDMYPYNTVLVGLYCYTGSYWDSIKGNCSNSPFVVNGGVRIFSKYPILSKHQYVFTASGYGTPDYYSNKGAVYVAIEKNNKKYHIVGTHLQADHDNYNGTSVRINQLKELKNWVKSFEIPVSEPLVYAGDMNVEYTDENSYDSMQNILNATLSYEFDPSTDMGTYSYHNTMVQDQYPDYNDTLDYILISKAHKSPMYVPEMEVLRFMKHGEDLSDHHPVQTKYFFTY